MRKHRDHLEEARKKKESADRLWDGVYRDVLAGKIELEYIVAAMDLCNRADKAVMAYESRRQHSTSSRL